jgi:hypothetical protein
MKALNKITRIFELLLDDICFLSILIFNILIGDRFLLKHNKINKIIIFGVPIVSLKYISKAIKKIGYETVTIVPCIYKINKENDFDLVSPSRIIRYRQLLSGSTWIIYFDSFHQMFGFLRFFPSFLKKISRVRLIAMPYGADACQYSLFPDTVLRHAFMIDYPHNTDTEDRLARNVRAISNCADVVIGCVGHIANLYRWDALPVHYYPLDISHLDGLKKGIVKNEKFTIIHTPNHRGVKGTELIIQAVNELCSEGVELELRLLQGLQNDEVIKNLHAAHLLIEQVIGSGYSLNGMEGMACGLPVISHISEHSCEIFRVYSHLNECPILNCTRNVESIKEKILESMSNHAELSKLSREYVEKYHSIKASSYFWKAVLTGESRAKLMTFYMPHSYNA